MRRPITAAVVVGLVLGIGAGVAVWAVWNRIHTPYKGYESTEQFVDIPAGTATAAIGRRLVEAGIVRDGFTFRAALWWTRRSQALQAGEYRFDRPLAAVDVIDRLARGDVYARRITFPEGLTIAEMARLYEAREFGSATSFVEAGRDASLIRDLDPLATDLEGYLFPDTYAMPRGTPARRLVALMVERFRAAYSNDLRRRAEEQALTTRQVVTLASLVEKETGRPEERPLVAAVYRNRLKIGMGLQADPTVVYALQKAGRYNGNIRRQDLAIDSPYNTYRYAGLPPGPIAAPGKASLDAALVHAPVSYLYFVSRNDGSHVFATTLAEHNRNVRKFQILYFRR
ncbi:MAG: endolytic transglycosylase MltG [Acidobacteria bacterium]|nr:endolytic transglycosylase MltG [Acidobacteriota bacterium]